MDRDERLGGVPVFANLAAALTDAGFVVARYDKRGVGRSSGRTESATLQDYADDALGVVQWLRKRRDVDANRVAVLGYAEGGAMALIAGSREKRIAALCLVAAPGQSGREFTLQQQQRALARSSESETSKLSKVALQVRIMDAVTRTGNWEGIAPELRQQADTQWFKSWLLFDPAKVVPKLKQPLLIVAGSLDAQFPPEQADRLEALGRARKKLPAAATQKAVVPGVNHQLVPATSGEEEEYPSLSGAALSPGVASVIVDWLKATLPAGKK
jgi:pimeloyl-ACP methyl ester carboxylesterase